VAVANGIGLIELDSVMTAWGMTIHHGPRASPIAMTEVPTPSDQLVQNNGKEGGKIPQHLTSSSLWMLISISLSLSL
jgi:hypothetical protein